MLGSPRRWSPGSRQLAVLFLLVLLPAGTGLIVLGVTLLDQDRRLASQREADRREATANAVVRSLGRALEDTRTALRSGEAPRGLLLVTIGGDVISSTPANALPWTPTPKPLAVADHSSFADAEVAEYQGLGDRGRSIYTRYATSSDARIRAAALVRLARLHRRAGRLDDALEAYNGLATITTVDLFHGMPADLVARRAMCDLLAGAGRSAELRTMADALEQDFVAGRWSLDHANWQIVASQIAKWTTRPPVIAADRRAAAAATDWLWHAVRATQPLPTSGHQIVTSEAGTVTAVWERDGRIARGLILSASSLENWIAQAHPSSEMSVRPPVLIADGETALAGNAPPPGGRSTRLPSSDTGLPWTVVVGSVPDTDVVRRQALLLSGLALLVLLLGGGAFLIWRLVQRELAVARLQTDFVAAVSHEFRTPLTSLRHVTELLQEDDELPRERRRSLYGAMERSTVRLGGLVESLLDFARMESGRKAYTLESTDADDLVASVVDEFTRHLDSPDVALTLTSTGRLTIAADRAALAHAVWNLLDNAVKYSTPPCEVRVRVERRGNEVVIGVEDQGLGIPRHEQRDIFGKFVRGADATQSGIKGTGLGLAMVSHIVRAHHGTVSVESDVGQGSTFTLTIPAAALEAHETGHEPVTPRGQMTT